MENYAVSQVPQGYLIQQGETPPHYTNIVIIFINDLFPDKWLEEDGPLFIRSTYVDFIFLGVYKGYLY